MQTYFLEIIDPQDWKMPTPDPGEGPRLREPSAKKTQKAGSFSLYWIKHFYEPSNLFTDTESVMDLDTRNLIKLSYCGLVLGLSQFLQLLQLPRKMASKVVKSDLKIIISVYYSKKSMTHFVYYKK